MKTGVLVPQKRRETKEEIRIDYICLYKNKNKFEIKNLYNLLQSMWRDIKVNKDDIYVFRNEYKTMIVKIRDFKSYF